MITNAAQDITEFIPREDLKSTVVEVQTSKGVGKLIIRRKDSESYFLSFWMPDGQKAHWESPLIPTVGAIQGVWFMCWVKPFGFLP